MKKGLIFELLLWKSTAVFSMPGRPPIPEPIMQPDLRDKSFVISTFESLKACSEAASEN